MMEQLAGHQRMVVGTVAVNGDRYEYESYIDPNRPHNFRTIVIYRPGKDSLIFEYDAEKEAFQNVVEKILGKD
jgi:hypothetical protein